MLTTNLRYLVALAQEQHFARAAKACQVTQPTLSAGIKQLEEDLGILIVERGQRFQGFTEEGTRVLAWARRILADVESLEQEVSEMRSRLIGRLRIGAIPTALPVAAELSAQFSRVHPGVSVAVISLTSIDIQRGLDDFTLDAGLTYLDNEPLARVRAVPLYREQYFLLTPAGGPFAGRTRVSWSDAASLPLSLLTPDMQNRRIVDANFRSAGVTLRAAVETNSVLMICAHVQSHSYSSILPQPFLGFFRDAKDIDVIPLVDPDNRQSVGLVVPDREPLTPSARALILLVEQAGGAVDFIKDLNRPVTATS